MSFVFLLSLSLPACVLCQVMLSFPTVAPGESLETLQEQSSLGSGIRHPPRGEWVKKIQQVDTVGFASFERNGMMTFAEKWLN